MAVQTQTSPPPGSKRDFPAPASDTPHEPSPARDKSRDLLQDEEIHMSPGKRVRLQRQIEIELNAAREEKEVLSDRVADSAAIPTAVGRVSSILEGRLKAINPIRDFDKIGFAALNNGITVWDDPSWNIVPAMGHIWIITATAVTWALSNSIPLTVGAGLFVLAPVFISMLAGRTAFNFVAGVAAAVAAPVAYGLARIADVTKHPGMLRAKKFLVAVENSAHLNPDQKNELREERVAILEGKIREKEEKLEDIRQSEGMEEMDSIRNRYMGGGVS